jgi:hypothetical protein
MLTAASVVGARAPAAPVRGAGCGLDPEGFARRAPDARLAPLAVSLLLLVAAPAGADLSSATGMPGVSVGINLSVYPELVLVPGYPVYYAPQVDSNYFFFDGFYWVYSKDRWYASSWYDGPWDEVQPDAVPLFVLRVPVSYYRQPPAYFRDWAPAGSPRWAEHWGRDWEQRRQGWDDWDRGSAPPPAPLPTYQREYAGDRYPHGEQQRAVQAQNYRYEPRGTLAKQQLRQPTGAAAVPKGPESRSDRPLVTPPGVDTSTAAQVSVPAPASTNDRTGGNRRERASPPPHPDERPEQRPAPEGRDAPPGHSREPAERPQALKSETDPRHETERDH